MNSRQMWVTTAVLLALAMAMSLYLWQLRNREALPPAATATATPVAPPKSGPTQQVTLWVADDDPGVLRTQSATIPLASGRQQQAQELLRALINVYAAKDSGHSLPPGAEVNNVYLVDPGLAVIDINGAFADGQTSGVLAEELTVASLIQTLSSNIQGLTQVKILADGKERDTLAGHADLSGIFSVPEVSELSRQLSTE
jgi:Sporulation and spore germination